ncbi:hypothetical protein BGZ65_004229 [Modicella reniformis]|uniref:D-arabinono-1,4-lactone oxidase n=1 Tax=Modicella reniformis TaxID=1440133 RepID=A0A9P6STE9_9FUNG|nr:hypothetical protein BGZ65_004229 [Modicella reniformis]
MIESRAGKTLPDQDAPQVAVCSPLAILDGVSFSGESWTNWSKSLEAKPTATWYPRSLADLQVILREAKANNKKIRCAGTGHSWCGGAVTGDYLVLNHSMNKIHEPKETNHGWTVTIETGVTVAELDAALRAHNPPLAVPSNVLPIDVRYGGILTMGCHGPSVNARSMCDMITEMTILNADGDLVTYSEAKDPEAFSAACVNLGLLGIIYTVTLKVETMNTRLRVKDSYPTLENLLDGPDAGLKLKARILNNEGTEFLYWPFKHFMKPDQNDAIWIKEWERTTEPAESVNPHEGRPPMIDNPFFSTFHVGERVLETPDALHFQLGDGVTTVSDAGAAIKADSDFKNIVQMFKELVEKNWAFTTSMPERMGTALEMRIIKASNKMMSPLYDEDPEALYCLVNVMAASGTPGFEDYSIDIVQNWIDKYQAKPHWPKMWEKVPGVATYLRREYGDRLVRFNRVRKTQDPQDMFVNDTWKPLLEDL